MTVGGLTAAAVTLGKGLLKRGIPGIALATLSDSIADYFIKGEGKDELRKQFSGALAGGGIGFTLFGKKGLAIGSLLGFLTKDKKVDEELGKLVDNLETLGKAIFGEFSFSGIAKKITEKAGSGLESLNNLISGDSFSDKNISGVVDDIQGAAGVLGVFAFFVSSKFRKALLSIRGLKKLAIFSGLLAIAKTLGYGLTPDKDGVPTSERPDMLDYGLAGGTLAYGAVKTAQAFRGGPQMARPIQKNYSEKFDEVRKMSKSQLKKVGIEKDGKSLTKSGGKIVGEADLDKALVNKYGKIFGPKGIARFAGGIFH